MGAEQLLPARGHVRTLPRASSPWSGPAAADGQPREAAPPAQLRLLGEFDLTVAGQQVPVGPGGVELLALLAVSGRQSRARAQATMWPDADTALTTGRLRSLIYRLRRTPGAEVVDCDSGPSLRLAHGLDVDYLTACQAASSLSGRSDVPVSLAEATRLFSADLLPSHSCEWLSRHQHAWSRTRLRALESCARRALATGDPETAIAACEKVILAEPLHEAVYYLMIGALLQEDYVRAATDVYADLVEALGTELARSPAVPFRKLHESATRLGAPRW